VRRTVRRELEKDGFVVHEVEDGRDGLAALDRDPPALVMTDVDLRRGGGVAALAELSVSFVGVPVIAWSDDLDENPLRVWRELRRFGVHIALGKPLDLGELRRAVEATLAGRWAHHPPHEGAWNQTRRARPRVVVPGPTLGMAIDRVTRCRVRGAATERPRARR
jgi:DNA-binding response OmpR family regulator